LLVLGLLFFAEPFKKLSLAHVLFSSQIIYRLIYCRDQTLRLSDVFLQRLAVALQRLQHVEARVFKDLLDLFERQLHFPVEQDLLQAQDCLLIVIPVSVIAHAGWFEHIKANHLTSFVDTLAAASAQLR
jgi:hypothetical protein